MEEVNSGTRHCSNQEEMDQEKDISSGLSRGWQSFIASAQEGLGYVKAFFVGQGKLLRARNEKEASEANLQTAKMQVEATDAAEDTKKQLQNSTN